MNFALGDFQDSRGAIVSNFGWVARDFAPLQWTGSDGDDVRHSEWQVATVRQIGSGQGRIAYWNNGHLWADVVGKGDPPRRLGLSKGSQQGEPHASTGDVAEVICWASALSDGEVDELHAYFQEKYGIPMGPSAVPPGWSLVARSSRLAASSLVQQQPLIQGYASRFQASLLAGFVNCGGVINNNMLVLEREWLVSDHASCGGHANVARGMELTNGAELVLQQHNEFRRIEGCAIPSTPGAPWRCDAGFRLDSANGIGVAFSVNGSPGAFYGGPMDGEAVDLFARVWAGADVDVRVDWAVDTEWLPDDVLRAEPSSNTSVADRTGNGFHGAFDGGVAFSNGVLRFNGSDGSVSSKSSFDGTTIADKRVCVAGWAVLAPSCASSSTCMIIGLAPAADDASANEGDTRALAIVVVDGVLGVKFGSCTATASALSGSLNSGSWYHVAASAVVGADVQATLQLFVNGVAVDVSSDGECAGDTLSLDDSYVFAGDTPWLLGVSPLEGSVGDVAVLTAADDDESAASLAAAVYKHWVLGGYQPIVYGRSEHPSDYGSWVPLLSNVAVAADALNSETVLWAAVGRVIVRTRAVHVSGSLSSCGSVDDDVGTPLHPWQACPNDADKDPFSFELSHNSELLAGTELSPQLSQLPHECHRPRLGDGDGDILCDVAFAVRQGDTLTPSWWGARYPEGVSAISSLRLNLFGWAVDEVPSVWWRSGLPLAPGGLIRDNYDDDLSGAPRGSVAVSQGQLLLQGPGAAVVSPNAVSLQHNFIGVTVMAWVALDGEVEATAPAAVGLVVGVAAVSDEDGSLAQLGLGLVNGAPAVVSDSQRLVSNGNAFSAGKWYHVAVVKDINGAVSLYVDGLLILEDLDVEPDSDDMFADLSGCEECGFGSSTFVVGSAVGSASLRGAVADPAVFPLALSPHQVQKWMRRGHTTGLGADVLPPNSVLIDDERAVGSHPDVAIGACTKLEPEAPSGVYWIRAAAGSAPYRAFCEMPGGWQIVRKSVKGQSGGDGFPIARVGEIPLSEAGYADVVTPADDGLQASRRWARGPWLSFARRRRVEWRKSVALYATDLPTAAIHTQEYELRFTDDATMEQVLSRARNGHGDSCVPINGNVEVLWTANVEDADWPSGAKTTSVGSASHVSWDNGPALTLMGCADGSVSPTVAAERLASSRMSPDEAYNVLRADGQGVLTPGVAHSVGLLNDEGWTSPKQRQCTYACRSQGTALSARKNLFEIETWSARVVATTASGVPSSCSDIARDATASGEALPQSGVFDIQPDPSAAVLQAYCDFSADGGGWTTLFARENPQEEELALFCRSRAEYVRGFGAPNASHWLGLSAMAALSQSSRLEARLERVTVGKGCARAVRTTQYDTFAVAAAAHGYRLTVRGAREVEAEMHARGGTVSLAGSPDLLSVLDGEEFVAYDDIDPHSACASASYGGGGFWRSTSRGADLGFNPTGIRHGQRVLEAARNAERRARATDRFGTGVDNDEWGATLGWRLLVREVVPAAPPEDVFVGQSCLDVLERSPELMGKSGTYWIQPDPLMDPVEVYCDMDGGWTALLRRSMAAEAHPPSADEPTATFAQNEASYEDGFGKPSGNHFLGLRNLRSLQQCSGARLEARFVRNGTTLDGKLVRRTTIFSAFGVGGATAGYRLSVEGGHNVECVVDGVEVEPDTLPLLTHDGGVFHDSEHPPPAGCAMSARGRAGFWASSVCNTANPTGVRASCDTQACTPAICSSLSDAAAKDTGWPCRTSPVTFELAGEPLSVPQWPSQSWFAYDDVWLFVREQHGAGDQSACARASGSDESAIDDAVAGGGWVPFWWWNESFSGQTVSPSPTSLFGVEFGECSSRGDPCFQRLPRHLAAEDTQVLAVDSDGNSLLFGFPSSSLASMALWHALMYDSPITSASDPTWEFGSLLADGTEGPSRSSVVTRVEYAASEGHAALSVVQEDMSSGESRNMIGLGHHMDGGGSGAGEFGAAPLLQSWSADGAFDGPTAATGVVLYFRSRCFRGCAKCEHAPQYICSACSPGFSSQSVGGVAHCLPLHGAWHQVIRRRDDGSLSHIVDARLFAVRGYALRGGAGGVQVSDVVVSPDGTFQGALAAPKHDGVSDWSRSIVIDEPAEWICGEETLDAPACLFREDALLGAIVYYDSEAQMKALLATLELFVADLDGGDCIAGFFLSDGACLPCSDDCESCLGSAAACTSCSSGCVLVDGECPTFLCDGAPRPDYQSEWTTVDITSGALELSHGLPTRPEEVQVLVRLPRSPDSSESLIMPLSGITYAADTTTETAALLVGVDPQTIRILLPADREAAIGVLLSRGDVPSSRTRDIELLRQVELSVLAWSNAPWPPSWESDWMAVQAGQIASVTVPHSCGDDVLRADARFRLSESGAYFDAAAVQSVTPAAATARGLMFSYTTSAVTIEAPVNAASAIATFDDVWELAPERNGNSPWRVSDEYSLVEVQARCWNAPVANWLADDTAWGPLLPFGGMHYGQFALRSGFLPYQISLLARGVAPSVDDGFVGCFGDSSSDRAMPHNLGAIGRTITACIAGCRLAAFAYAGLQGDTCWCSSSDDFDKHGESSFCTKPCTDDPTTMCGGYVATAVSVYAISPQLVPPGQTMWHSGVPSVRGDQALSSGISMAYGGRRLRVWGSLPTGVSFGSATRVAAHIAADAVYVRAVVHRSLHDTRLNYKLVEISGGALYFSTLYVQEGDLGTSSAQLWIRQSGVDEPLVLAVSSAIERHQTQPTMLNVYHLSPRTRYDAVLLATSTELNRQRQPCELVATSQSVVAVTVRTILLPLASWVKFSKISAVASDVESEFKSLAIGQIKRRSGGPENGLPAELEIEMLDSRAVPEISAVHVNWTLAVAPSPIPEYVRQRTTSVSPPKQPGVEVVEITGGAVYLDLTDPEDTGGAVLVSLDIMVFNASSTSPQPLLTIVVENRDATVPVVPLDANTAYTIEVIAVSENDCNGIGLPVEFNVSTGDVSLPLVPQNVELDGEPTSDRIFLAWDPPIDMGGGGAVTYDVAVAGVNSADSLEVLSIGETQAAEVSGLQPQSAYEVRVRAVNSLGAGDWTDGLLATTSTGRPPTAVATTGVHNTTGGAATVSWEIASAAGGRLVEYEVFVSTSTVPLSTGPPFCTVPATSTSCRGGGLLAGTGYFASTRARNIVGVGAIGPSFAFQTGNLSEPTQPLAASVAATTGGATSITWQPPVDSGGIEASALWYNATLLPADGSGDGALLLACTCTEAYFSRLRASTQYEFSVFAWYTDTESNEEFSGHSSEPLMVSTEQISEPSAVEDLDVIDSSGGAVVIGWSESRDLGGVALRNFEVDVFHDDGREQRFTTQESMVTVGGLLTSEEVSVIVTAVNIAGMRGEEVEVAAVALDTPTLPSAPLGFQLLTLAEDAARLTMQAPMDSGGVANLSYAINVTLPGDPDFFIAVEFDGDEVDVDGLMSDIAFMASVRATHAFMAGLYGPPLLQEFRLIRPTGEPLAPFVSYTSGDCAGLSWLPPLPMLDQEPSGYEIHAARLVDGEAIGDTLVAVIDTTSAAPSGAVCGLQTDTEYELFVCTIWDDTSVGPPSEALVATTTARLDDTMLFLSAGSVSADAPALPSTRRWTIVPSHEYANIALSLDELAVECDFDGLAIYTTDDAEPGALTEVWSGGCARLPFTPVVENVHGSVVVELSTDEAVGGAGVSFSYSVSEGISEAPLVARVQPSCPLVLGKMCASHGSCLGDGSCVCSPGYYGEGCQHFSFCDGLHASGSLMEEVCSELTRVLVVSSYGTDDGTGHPGDASAFGAPGKPFKTIRQALDAAAPDSIVAVEPGQYDRTSCGFVGLKDSVVVGVAGQDSTSVNCASERFLRMQGDPCSAASDDAVCTALVIEGMTFSGGHVPGDGGVLLADGADVSLRNVRIEAVSSDGDGGAIALYDAQAAFDDVLILQSRASGCGGAIDAHSSDLRATGVTISHTTARCAGGIRLHHSSFSCAINSTCSISHSSALTGGGVVMSGLSSLAGVAVRDSTAGDGGAVAIEHSAVGDVDNVTLSGCTAASSGGAVYVSAHGTLRHSSFLVAGNAASIGGGVAMVESGTFVGDGVATAQLVDNVAANRGGGMFVGGGHSEVSATAVSNNQAPLGGGLSVENCTMTLNQVLISDNTASGNRGGGGMFASNATILVPNDGPRMEIRRNAAPAACGAGILVAHVANVQHMRIFGGHAHEGGGVCLEESARMGVAAVEILDNAASGGGGLYLRTLSAANLYGVRLASNIADNGGGALLTQGSHIDGLGSVLEINYARFAGGNLLCEDCLGVSNSVLRSGRARVGGGAAVRSSNAGVVSTFSHVSISNSSADVGGGLFAACEADDGPFVLRLEEVSIADTSAAYCGGSAMLSSLTLLADAVAIHNGSAPAGGGIFAHGASIISASDDAVLTVANCTAASSSALSSLQPEPTDVLDSTGHVLVSASLFHHILHGVGGGLVLAGGCGSVDGSAVRCNISGVNVTDSVASVGAAVYFDASTASMRLLTAEKCSANVDGGGIAVLDSNVRFVDTSVRDCRAHQRGGGVAIDGSIVSMSQLLVEENSASMGGGLLLKDSDMISEHSVVRANVASCIDGGPECSLGGNVLTLGLASVNGSRLLVADGVSNSGGGIAVAAFSTFSGSSITMENNSAVGQLPAGFGGALIVSSDAVATIDNSVLRDNTARYAGGGAFTHGALSVRTTTIVGNSVLEFDDAEAVSGSGGGVAASLGGSAMSLVGCSIRQNSAPMHAGGVFASEMQECELVDTTISESRAGGRGGALYVRLGVCRLLDTTLQQSTATLGGCGAFFESNVELRNTRVTGCSASDNGGGIFMLDSDLTASGLWVSYCSSGSSGGGLSLTGGSTTMSHSSVEQCDATFDGGAVNVMVTRLEVEDSEFAHNQALSRGGAFAVAAGTIIRLEGCQLLQNTGSYSGGAVFGDRRSTVELVDTVVADNTVVEEGGGAVALFSGTGLVTRCVMTRNSAARGGALFVPYSILQSSGSSYSQHFALIGGAVSVSERGVFLSDNDVFHNNSADTGGAVNVGSSGAAFVSSAVCEGNFAGDAGGCVSISGGYLELVDSSLLWNAAGSEGGAIVQRLNGTMRVSNVEVSDNAVPRDGISRGGGACVDSPAHMHTAGVTWRRNSAWVGGAVFYRVAQVLSQNAVCTGCVIEANVPTSYATPVVSVDMSAVRDISARSGVPVRQEAEVQAAPFRVVAIDGFGQRQAADMVTRCQVTSTTIAVTVEGGTAEAAGASLQSVLGGNGGIVELGNARFLAELGDFDINVTCTRLGGTLGQRKAVTVTILPCAAGTALNTLRVCEICPGGSYSIAGEACYPCPQGADCQKPSSEDERIVTGVIEPASREGYWLAVAPATEMDDCALMSDSSDCAFGMRVDPVSGTCRLGFPPEDVFRCQTGYKFCKF